MVAVADHGCCRGKPAGGWTAARTGERERDRVGASKLEIVQADDKGTTDGAKAAAQQLLEGVNVVFGHLASDVTVAAAPTHARGDMNRKLETIDPLTWVTQTMRFGGDGAQRGAWVLKMSSTVW